MKVVAAIMCCAAVAAGCARQGFREGSSLDLGHGDLRDGSAERPRVDLGSAIRDSGAPSDGQDATPHDGAAARDAASAADQTLDAEQPRPDSAPRADAVADSAAQLDATQPADCQIFHPVALPAEVVGDPIAGFWAAAPDDLRAVTQGGKILRWDGCRVRNEHTASGALAAIWGSSATNVWVAGEGDSVLRWNGATWSPLVIPATSVLRGVWGSGPDDVWFVGSPAADTRSFYALRWNPTDGFSAPRVRNISVIPYAIWGSGPSDVWIVGSHGMVRHNGRGFSEFEYNYDTDYLWYATSIDYRSIQGYGPNDIDIGGRAWNWSGASGSSYRIGIKHWDGSALTTDFASLYGYAWVHGSGPAERWRVGARDYVQRNQGGGWLDVLECGATSSRQFTTVHVLSATDVWLGGPSGGLYHYCGNTTRDQDGDGHHAALCGGDDCDDCARDVHPGVVEGPPGSPSCNDGIDNDCDGLIDSADSGCS